MLEIERKFLVKTKAYKATATSHSRITQGYLNSDPSRTVRVRIYGATGFLTIKGKSNTTGTSRFEWEKEIDLKEAETLLLLCEAGVIDKTRYLVPNGKFTFEVDVFYGDNTGLVVAEIELHHPEDPFEKPDWLGEEVTGEGRYYNSQLSKNPFASWDK